MSEQGARRQAGAGRIIGIVLAVVLAAAAVGYYFVSPYLAMDALRAAARNGDRDRLEQLVDFRTLRANLKHQLSAKLEQAVGRDAGLRASPLAALGALIAPAIANHAIDAYVTPDAIAEMVNTARGSPGGSGQALMSGPDAPKLKSQMGYADLDHFRTRLTEVAGPPGQVTLTLERRNLFTWKLTRIDFDLGPIDRGF